jgi:hypothetical protein
VGHLDLHALYGWIADANLVNTVARLCSVKPLRTPQPRLDPETESSRLP